MFPVNLGINATVQARARITRQGGIVRRWMTLPEHIASGGAPKTPYTPVEAVAQAVTELWFGKDAAALSSTRVRHPHSVPATELLLVISQSMTTAAVTARGLSMFLALEVGTSRVRDITTTEKIIETRSGTGTRTATGIVRERIGLLGLTSPTM